MGKGLLVLMTPAFPTALTLPEPRRDSVLPLCAALGLHCDNASAGLLLCFPRGPLDEVSWGMSEAPLLPRVSLPSSSPFLSAWHSGLLFSLRVKIIEIFTCPLAKDKAHVDG